MAADDDSLSKRVARLNLSDLVGASTNTKFNYDATKADKRFWMPIGLLSESLPICVRPSAFARGGPPQAPHDSASQLCRDGGKPPGR
jgi:hypothetical protein